MKMLNKGLELVLLIIVMPSLTLTKTVGEKKI